MQRHWTMIFNPYYFFVLFCYLLPFVVLVFMSGVSWLCTWYFYHGTALGYNVPSYRFVLDYPFINKILFFPSFHFAHVSVLLCLTITPVRSPFIMEHLSLSLKLHWPPHSPPSKHLQQPHWLTPYYWDFPHWPHFSLYKFHIGATGFLLDSWTLRVGSRGCPETSVRNYHYSLHKNPEEHISLIQSPSCSHTWKSAELGRYRDSSYKIYKHLILKRVPVSTTNVLHTLHSEDYEQWFFCRSFQKHKSKQIPQ